VYPWLILPSRHRISSTPVFQTLAMRTVPSSPPRATVPMHPKVPISLDSEMVHLLTVFQKGVATWMDLLDHDCTYERTVSQRAVGSECLLRCVCGFAAKQLSLLPNGEVWTPIAAQRYVEPLGPFIKEVDPSAPLEDALTAIMMRKLRNDSSSRLRASTPFLGCRNRHQGARYQCSIYRYG
jgi:hypothetical protein